MAKLLKLRRGTTTQHGSFTGAEGEVTIDTTKDTAVVHDGSTQAGRPLAREDMSNVSSASIAGRLGTDSIATSKIAGGALPTDVTVASANLVDGTIVNADVNASAAIAGTKIAPDFGSQTIATTGSTNIGNDLNVTGATPHINFVDSGDNPDFQIGNINGGLRFQDTTNHLTRILINADGHVDVAGNLDVGAGIDVTGAITSTGDLTITSTQPAINFADSDNNPDYKVRNSNGGFIVTDTTNSVNRIIINPDGHIDIANNVDFAAGIDVTGNITTTGTVDGRDVAADGTKLDGIESSATADQTASEIAAALDGQNIYTTQKIGRNSSDYIQWSPNTHIDFYINGSNEFRFENDGDFHADGDVIAQSTTISSDIRLKENIQVVPNALDKVESLRGVTFDWKRDGTPSAGVIAQEVQGVLPEAVKEVTPVKGGDSHLSVNYHALTSILIESIKELKAEIEKLKGGE